MNEKNNHTEIELNNSEKQILNFVRNLPADPEDTYTLLAYLHGLADQKAKLKFEEFMDLLAKHFEIATTRH